MSNDSRPEECERVAKQVRKPTDAHSNDAQKLAPRCRVGGSGFKLQLAHLKEKNPNAKRVHLGLAIA